MRKPGITLDTQAAMGYIGESVLMELYMDEGEPPYWCCVHIVGVVLEKEGVWDYPYFMAMSFTSDGRTPSEIPFMDILTIRVMRHRDRHGSGNVLDRIALPNAGRSGAALPARRDSFTVPSNGSTGAAHP
jgi:hypothetical protein